MNILKQLRYENGVPLASVAEAAGITRQTLGRLENGHTDPSAATAKALAEYYKVTVPQLMGSEPLPTPAERAA